MKFILSVLKKVVFLQTFSRERKSVQWCNGSTSDSGSASLGSSPGWTTKRGRKSIDLDLFSVSKML